MSAPPESRGSFAGAWLRRLGPWVLAAAILYWIFSLVPVDKAWTAAAGADLRLFVPATLAAVTYWFLLESRAFAYLFSRFNAPLPWGEARSLRGMTYLLTPINWNLGNAAMIVHLRVTKGVSALAATSSLFFYASLDTVVLASLVFAGAVALPATPTTESMMRIAGTVVATQVLFLAVLVSGRPAWRPLAWLRERRIFASFTRARPRDLGVLASIRSAYFAGFIVFFWLGARAFQIDLPFAFAAAVTPLVMVAGALPITPAGLGTQQAAMLFFFEAYGDQGAVLAFGLAFPAALILARLPIGFLYARELASFRRLIAGNDAS